MPLEAHITTDQEPDSVTFTVTITNTGPDPVTLTFPTGQLADVIVSQNDETIWQWSEGRMFTQAIRDETLATGDSLETTATWSDPKSGEYTVDAIVKANQTTLQTQTTITR